MGKRADELLKEQGENIRQSISKGQATGARPAIPPARAAKDRELGVARNVDALDIELDQIQPDPEQPRKIFSDESLQRMAASLLRYGQIQPIRVKWSASAKRWVIISGERRYRAARIAGMKTLTVIEDKTTRDSSDLLAKQLVENMLRENLDPIDQGRKFRELMDANGWSGHQLAEELSISQPTVVQALAIFESPESLRERVALGELKASSAYELTKIADPVLQEEVAAQVVDEDLTRDEVRARVKQAVARATPNKGRGAKGKRPQLRVTTWSFKAPGGYVLRVECRKGIDLAQLPIVLEQARGRAEDDRGRAESVA